MGRVLRVLASADFPFAFSLAVHSAVGGSIAEHGSPSQIDRYIRRIQTGELILSVCITEPSAGSDAAAMQTRATRIQGGRISGSKAWVTNAASADLFLLSAQTDVDGAPAGIAAFLVERERPGLSITPPTISWGAIQWALLGRNSPTVSSPMRHYLLDPEKVSKGR
jgi:alkylation response protein AidB-like acyl-CoA dehydrogenase